MAAKETSTLISLLQGLRNSLDAIDAFTAAKKLADAEGRELTDAELDGFRADTDAARDRLVNTPRPGGTGG